MKVRAAVTRTARRPALTVVGWAILAILVAAAVSACTPSPATTSVYLPTASGVTSSAGTSTATVTTSASDSTSPSTLPTNTITVTITPTYSPIPTAAPVTGGGGTAGLQDGALFLIGGVAILFGAGSFLYRKKQIKDR
jgi:hypothetical protein